METRISQDLVAGRRPDDRRWSLSDPAELHVTTVKGQKVGRFLNQASSNRKEVFPPLWRVELLEITELSLVLTGLQRTNPRAPLQYQIWKCDWHYRVRVTELWYGGAKKDARALSLSKEYRTGELRFAKGQRQATLIAWANGGMQNLLQPLQRAELLELDGNRLLIGGVQHVEAGGPLSYQEWSCEFRPRKP